MMTAPTLWRCDVELAPLWYTVLCILAGYGSWSLLVDILEVIHDHRDDA
jgi:hypothetical protein